MHSPSLADPAREAAAAFERGVVREPPPRALLTVRGKDRVDFVNRMCTNDATKLTTDFGVAAVLPTAKGRIVDLVRAFVRGDEIVLLGSEGHGAKLKEWLEKFIVMEELAIADASTTDASLVTFGPHAEAAVQRVLGVAPVPRTGGFGVASTQFEGVTVNVLGRGEPPLATIELVAPAAVAPSLRARLVDAGLQPIGEPAWEQVRIEAGLPRFGRELSDNVNPLEAGLLSAVSFIKGCYIGQEVVARLNNYSKVQRLLVGVKFAAGVEPTAVNEIFWDLLRIGHASSVARSARLGATVALAFVKSEYAKPGTAVYTVHGGDHLQGTLCEVPFR